MILSARDAYKLARQNMPDDEREKYKLSDQQISNRIENAALKGEVAINLACPEHLLEKIKLELQEAGYTVSCAKEILTIRWGS